VQCGFAAAAMESAATCSMPSAAPSSSRAAEVSRRKRSLRNRSWNPEIEIDQGNPAYPGTQGYRVSTAAYICIRFLATSKTLSRNGTIVLHYRFYDLGAV
jgi:hypothetical protein